MPTAKSSLLPRPSDWQDFQRLCRDLFAAVWSDPGTQEVGRLGQAQAGVDVFGRPNRGAAYAGVQARKRAEPLRYKELELAIDEARRFEPPLETFILATTAARDAKLQQRARLVSRQNAESGEFRVEVWSWDDICAELTNYPQLVTIHYPAYRLAGELPPTRVKRGPVPVELIRFTSGDELLTILDGMMEFGYEYDSPMLPEHRETVAEFISLVGDCDVLPDLNPGQRVRVAGELDDAIQALQSHGLWVFGAVSIGTLESNDLPTSWRTVHLRIVSGPNPSIVRRVVDSKDLD